MKKMIIAIGSALAMTLCASADTRTPLSNTGFDTLMADEKLSTGSDDGDGTSFIYWESMSDPSKNESEVKAYDPAVAGNVNYVQVDTSEPIRRRAYASGATPGNIAVNETTSAYFSARVQFTASDADDGSTLAETDGEGNYIDKILIWLKGNDNGTNLVVTANNAALTQITDFTLTNSVSADTWYNVEIRTLISNGALAFNVFLNNDLVVASDGTDTFYSLVNNYAEDGRTITSAGFLGYGKIDDLEWSKVETTVDTFTLEVASSQAGVTFDKGNESGYTGETINCNSVEEDLELTFYWDKDTTGLTPVDGDYYTLSYNEDEDLWTMTILASVLNDQVANATITVTLQFEAETPKVCKIGDTEYASLAEAFAAVQSGETIKLTKDIELANGDPAIVIPATFNGAIDLNGHVIQRLENSYYVLDIPNGAIVEIKDTATGGMIKGTPVASGNTTNPASLIRNKGALTLTSGSLVSDYCCVKVDEDPGVGTFTMNGGSIEIIANSQGYTGLTFTVMNWGVTTLNGGSHKGNVQSLSYAGNSASKASTLSVNDGTYDPANIYLLAYDTTYTPTVRILTTLTDTLTAVNNSNVGLGYELKSEVDGDYTVYTLAVPTQEDDWAEDAETIEEGTSAATAYPALADTELATADAKKLTTWAKSNTVTFPAAPADAAALVDAYLLNCAPTPEAVAAATANFKVPSITVNSDGTVDIATPAGEYNGTVTIQGSTTLTKDEAAWHEKQAGDQFFRAVLSL